jgi:hypothetical protein
VFKIKNLIFSLILKPHASAVHAAIFKSGFEKFEVCVHVLRLEQMQAVRIYNFVAPANKCRKRPRDSGILFLRPLFFQKKLETSVDRQSISGSSRVTSLHSFDVMRRSHYKSA